MVIDRADSDTQRSRTPLKRRSMKNPRYFMSRAPSGGPCLEESASETEGLGWKWTVRISYFIPLHSWASTGPAALTALEVLRSGQLPFGNPLQRPRTSLLVAGNAT
jgi:hypothetical protein